LDSFFHLDDAQKSFILRVGTTFAADICSTHARPAAPYTSHLRGSPGTGKSLLILLLQKLCALIVEHHLCSQDEIDSCILLVTHNGAPAQLIGGQTLDSVINSFSPAASLEGVFLGGVCLVVVEECSSVRWWKLALLSIGFCHPKSGGSSNHMNTLDGVSVVAVYDVCQLGPVKDSNIFCSLREFQIILSK
jgi:hypothetical protein